MSIQLMITIGAALGLIAAVCLLINTEEKNEPTRQLTKQELIELMKDGVFDN